ncbi:MAG: hypothetical protein ABW277_27380 [Longimicrobiaceae bacterium]
MTAVHRYPRIPIAAFVLLLAAIYAAELLVVGPRLLPTRPELGAGAITFDLVVAVPALFYLLVVRTMRLPVVTLVPVFLGSLFGASLVLPEENRRYLDLLGGLVVPAELLLLGYVALRLHRGRSAPAAGRGDPLDRLRATLRQVLPSPLAADAVAHEAALLGYALLAWRARPDVREGELGFTSHRGNGYGGVLAAAALMVVVETVAVHLLVERWSATAAWALTALSLYGLVWLLGHFQAVRLRPVLLTADALHVRVGLVWSVRVPYGDVASLGAAGAGAPARRAPGYLHAVTLGPARLLVELREPVRVDGLYGYVRKDVRRIGLAVDDRERFRAELERRVEAAR